MRPASILIALSAILSAADGPISEMKPLLATRGKLLFSDDFTGASVGKEWQARKGRYEVADGALHGVELASDKHPANIVHVMDYKDVLFQFSFRFEGGCQLGLILLNSKGHVGRVTIRPNEFMVFAEKANANAPGKSDILSKVSMTFERGQWYTMLLEAVGARLLARVDDQHVTYGEDNRLDTAKRFFGLPVNGDGASFAHVRVWEAIPDRNWNRQQIENLLKH
jgi:hypothetical protein